MNVRMKLAWFAAAAMACSGAAFGQAPPPAGPGPGGRHHVGGPMRFDRFEMALMGKTVTGAPYSAQIVTKRNQTLGDGTHVTQESTSSIYRDSAGRVRHEMNFSALDSLTDSAQPRHGVFISDPVAGYHYTLHADTKTAVRMPAPSFGSVKELGSQPPLDGEEVATESLGTRMIEGVSAEGTRITKTIPVGARGNDKAIKIVIERWHSPELQVDVLVKHSDPWRGDSTVQLTKISRTEPAASLFAVPADYAVRDRPAPRDFGPRRGGAAPPPKD